MTLLRLSIAQPLRGFYRQTSNGSPAPLDKVISNGVKFDEKDYFEFYPLPGPLEALFTDTHRLCKFNLPNIVMLLTGHVLHKPKKNSRRRKITTNEGVYKINQDRKKILSVRPIQI